MSSSIPTTHFLLDENVRAELRRYLISEGFDVKLSPRSTDDGVIANLSRKEKRILVTNDHDFCEYTLDKIFSVVWLRIPQNEPKTLINSFDKLVHHFKNFEGRLIILTSEKWSDFSLGERIEFES